MIAITAKRRIRARPKTPILFSLNMPQVCPADRLNRRQRIFHIGTFIRSSAWSSAGVMPPTATPRSASAACLLLSIVMGARSRNADPGVEDGVEDIGDEVAEQGQHARDGQRADRQRD